uniref:Uncharacterized protein n=1 Tax=Cyclopterus lumpus TaxID=8103 RepID=A0A8C2Z129_CYCLU
MMMNDLFMMLFVPCGGRDCSTCQCFPAKGARVRLRPLTHSSQSNMFIYSVTL